MPRRPRIALAGVPFHIIQRGNNRSACFFADEDYRFYLDRLTELAEKFGCAVHAYVLMTNHVHLLLTPEKADSVSLVLKHLGQRYVQYINRTYRRSGTLWEGRYRSCLAREDDYILACYRYIEMNPVRAAMVKHPRFYRWSSYRSNAEGATSSLITLHEHYRALGGNEAERRLAYRALFKTDLHPEVVSEIRAATNGNFALGSQRFQDQVAAMLGRRVTRGKAGRPPNGPARSASLYGIAWLPHGW